MNRTLSLSGLALLLPLCASALDLVQIPAGTFDMGAAGIATPVHEVVLGSDYLLGRTELTNLEMRNALQFAWDNGLVTVEGDWVRGWNRNLVRVGLGDYSMHELRFASGEFQLVAGSGVYANWGPGFADYDPAVRPANYMTWFGAAAICDFLSLMEGREPYYMGDWSQRPDHDPYLAEGYRLPTEAEWEHASRWPDGRLYPWLGAISCAKANTRWTGDYCTGWTVDTGSYPDGASALGILDLCGNVNEWVGDWYASYPAAPAMNPMGPATGTSKILRGGSWTAQGPDANAPNRRLQSPFDDTGTPWFAGSFGMRVARSVLADDVAEAREGLPASHALGNAYPNPFNPTTTLPVELAELSRVRLVVHDLLGREVAVLHDGLLEAGTHSFEFQARNLPSGVYVAHLSGDVAPENRKLLLVR